MPMGMRAWPRRVGAQILPKMSRAVAGGPRGTCGADKMAVRSGCSATMHRSSCSTLRVALMMAAVGNSANAHGVVHSSCSAAGDCSARLQAALTDCCLSAVDHTSFCEVQLAPPGAVFRLEQSSALTVSGSRGGIALRGDGARLELRGDAAFLAVDCTASGLSRCLAVLLAVCVRARARDSL